MPTEDANPGAAGAVNVAAAMGNPAPAAPADAAPAATGTNNGEAGGAPNAATPPEATPGQTTPTGSQVDPAIAALMAQHKGDPALLAQAKQSTDQQYGKLKTETVTSFANIIRTNPDAIHSLPESMRDAVVKDVYGHLKIETYDALNQASQAGDPNKADPFEESRRTAFVQDAFTGFAKEAGLEPDENATEEEQAEYKSIFSDLSEIAVGILSTDSSLLGEDRSLKNAFRIAYFATPKGQARLVELGRMDGLKQNFGKNAGNLNLAPGKNSAKDIAQASKDSMLRKMGAPAGQPGTGPKNPLDV